MDRALVTITTNKKGLIRQIGSVTVVSGKLGRRDGKREGVKMNLRPGREKRKKGDGGGAFPIEKSFCQ